MSSDARPAGVLRYEEDWADLLAEVAGERAAVRPGTAARRFASAVTDPGSLVELGSLVRGATEVYQEYSPEAVESPAADPGAGLVAGWGTVDGAVVFVVADDPPEPGLARPPGAERKAARARSLAGRGPHPLVEWRAAYSDADDGARGSRFLASSFGAGLRHQAAICRDLPHVVVVAGPLAGLAAIAAAAAHFVICMPEGSLDLGSGGMAGADLLAAGLADHRVADAGEAARLARSFLRALCPGPPAGALLANGPPAAGPAGFGRYGDLLDPGSQLSLRAGGPAGALTGIGRLDGRPAGLVVLAGPLGSGECIRARSALELFDCCALPVVVVVDDARGFPDDAAVALDEALGRARHRLTAVLASGAPPLPGLISARRVLALSPDGAAWADEVVPASGLAARLRCAG